MNSRFKDVINHLEKLPRDFFGEIKIRFRNGHPVLIAEERTLKLDKDREKDQSKE